jgi:hypothetical protein
MSQPVIKTLPLSLVGKLTVTFLLSCGVTPSLLSCGICACNSTSFTRHYENDIVRFSGTPFEVSYTGENIVAVTIFAKREVVFVNVITNTITNTVDIGLIKGNSHWFS